MNHNAKRLLSFVLLLCLFTALLSVSVFAVEVPEISCELGASMDYTIPLEGGGTATGFEMISGTLPSGVSATLSDGAVKLVGTPGASGDYDCTIRIRTADSSDEYHVRLKITLPEVLPTPTPTPEATPAPTPTPEPTPSPTPVPAPSITKHPTGESVIEGNSAIFIAYADNADTLEWRIQSPDEKTEYNASDIGKYFPGCYAEGYDEDTLILFNIRYEMNGWKARCKFIGDGGTAFTNGAVITVDRGGLNRPSITRDPFVTADSDTLSVTATDPNGGQLHYQWYSSTDNSNANTDRSDVAIAGATSPTFVPPETPGTVYYYCTVWSTRDGQTSSISTSRVAAVTHAVPVTPEPSPTPTPSPSTAPEATAPTNTPAASGSSARRGSSGSQFLLFLMGFLILALIAAAVALVIISRREKELDDEEDEEEEAKPVRKAKVNPVEKSRLEAEKMSAAIHAEALRRTFHADDKPSAPAPEPETSAEEPVMEEQISLDDLDKAEEASAVAAGEFMLDGWYCEKCGTFNRGHNCTACGQEKPKDAIQYVCDRCGWTNPDPDHPPRFCPDCGAPFAAADQK